jgi:hypothetical protein
MGCKVKIKCCDHHRKHKRKFRLVASQVQFGNLIIKGRIMAVQMSDIQKTTLTVPGGLDAKGNPAPLDGPVTFTSSDPTILTVNPTSDTTCDVISTGALGTAQAQYSADANIDPAVVDTISGFTDFTIINSQAVGLTAQVGPIVNQ